MQRRRLYLQYNSIAVSVGFNRGFYSIGSGRGFASLSQGVLIARGCGHEGMASTIAQAAAHQEAEAIAAKAARAADAPPVAKTSAPEKTHAVRFNPSLQAWHASVKRQRYVWLAMNKLRIGLLGWHGATENGPWTRQSAPNLPRRTPRYGLQPWRGKSAGVAKRPRE